MTEKKAVNDIGMIGKHVIVTTDKDRRGVFFGKLVVGDVVAVVVGVGVTPGEGAG